MNLEFLRKAFLKGLLAVLPVVVTFLLIAWLLSGLESTIRAVFLRLVPEDVYFPGMGVLAAVVVVFAIGVLLQAISARKVWSLGEMLLSRMPVVSQLYRALKQIISYVGGSEMPADGLAVLVDFPHSGARMMGIVTAQDLAFDADNEMIAVLLPWSYQVGGITVIVPRASVHPVDMSPQSALQFSFTAGVAAEPQSGSGS